MFDWNTLLDEKALASVLPGDYARFARPVRDGLIVLLGGLPAAHQAEILAQQAALPPSACISERLAALARCCPVLHKLGQVLARDQRLAPQLRQQLRTLESLAPTVPETVIHEIVTRELGPLEQVGIRLRWPAIAEASVAVVVPFVEPERDRGGRLRGGVLKVLKPGIEERLALELDLLGRVGVHLDESCESLGIPALDYEELFQQIREKLSHEVKLDEEQRHLARAAACYADEPRVHIPAVLEYCTPRITAMERITGGKVTDHLLDRPHDKRQLAKLIVRSLIGHPVFSPASEAMFHSDPHAGNLFLTDDNRLGILDWSLVGSLGDEQRVAIVQILISAIALDASRIVVILNGLNNAESIDRPALAAVVEASLKRIRHGMAPGLSWIIGLLDEAIQKAGLRVAADLLLFRKSLHTLEGVIAEIGDAEVQIDDVLLVDFLGNFACELPRRWRAAPSSRAFVTHLSNADLALALLDSPASFARFWAGKGLDLLDACGATDTLRA
jgi:ubiquinone biosynthesis protein